MMSKTIFCVVHEDDELKEARRAVELARGCSCHLSLAVIGVFLPPPTAIAYTMVDVTWMQEREVVEHSVAAKAEKLEALLQEADVSGDVSQHCLMEGGVAPLVGLRARYSDLALVFPQTSANAGSRNATLKGLIFEGGVPFILAAPDMPLSLTPETVVIAWNSTPEAARAVHGSLDILSKAKKVVVVMIDPIASEWHNGAEPGFDVGSFLARHGVHTEIECLPGSGRDPADVIVRCARDRNAGLIVMGAYGHSRLREYVFGGTTRRMLEQPAVPVLMAH